MLPSFVRCGLERRKGREIELGQLKQKRFGILTSGPSRNVSTRPLSPSKRRKSAEPPPPPSAASATCATAMRFLLSTLALLGTLFNVALSAPLEASKSNPRPLVIWHGLGDSAHSEGMDSFVNLIKDVHPGIFVHSVYISEDMEEDKKAGFVSLAFFRSS